MATSYILQFRENDTPFLLDMYSMYPAEAMTHFVAQHRFTKDGAVLHDTAWWTDAYKNKVSDVKTVRSGSLNNTFYYTDDENDIVYCATDKNGFDKLLKRG